jgi:serine/threonine-protein kinase PpkA
MAGAPWRTPVGAALLLLAALLMASSPAAARGPLLMEGKQTLFQKVLTRPGIDLRTAPAGDAEVIEAALPAFSLFYVYDRKEAGGQSWIEVGRDRTGNATGWLPAEATIPWKQTIVAAFSNPAGRERTLLFDSRDQLIDLLEAENVVPRAAELRQQAIADSLPPDTGVVSIEPETYVDIADQFYLLPILDFEEVFLASGFRDKILKVASVPLDIDPLQREPPSREELLKAFDAGIVFVIDTTTSMGPYIDSTRKAIERIYDAVAASEVGKRVHFGLIGFRDSVQLVSALEYVTRTFVPLSLEQTPDQVIADLGQVKEATVSSKGFDEDSMAGIDAAIEQIDWQQFDGRYIVLITDAGPRAADDPNAALRLAPAEVNAAAADKGIAIYTLHLKTPAGAFDHEPAERAYRALSRFDGQELYYAVADGSVAGFDAAVGQLSQALVGQLQDTASGVLSEAAAESGDPLVDQARLVGLAMQLAYLGRAEGTQAPSVFEAWMSELAFEDPRRHVPEIRLVLSKNELATMRDVLKALVDKFEGNLAARMDAGTLFRQLREAMATIAREPDRVVDVEFESLGGAVGEYLEDLPYQSEIMGLDERTWAQLGGGRQREIIDAIKSKLAYYERVHNDPGLWTALYDGAPPGEQVFAIPLSRLP